MIDKAIEELRLALQNQAVSANGEYWVLSTTIDLAFNNAKPAIQSLLTKERQRNDKLVELMNNINDEIIEWDLDGAKDENNLPSMIYDWSDKITELAIEQNTSDNEKKG